MSFLILRQIDLVQEAFVMTAGRALAICQHFEDCTRHVMVVWGVTDDIAAGVDDHEALRELGRRLGRLGLGRAVGRLEQAKDFGAERAEVLERGRVARNWFAHESLGQVGFEWSARSLTPLVRDYSAHLRDLCEADALASRASYEICEKESAPHRLVETYANELFAWAMSPLTGMVSALEGDSR